MKTLSIAATLVSLAGLVACSSGATGAGAAVAQPSAAVADAPLQPAASHATPAAATNAVTGPVLETMNSGGYTYVRVKGSTGDIWAATGEFKVAVGDEIVVPLENPMGDFRSETLKRTFPLIYFVGAITRPGEPTASAAADAQTSMGTPPAVVPQGPIEKIPPVAGSVTVASVIANAKSLAGKSVTLRGKVVKYNSQILGSNWLHIQDGSGVVKDGTHDIAVTTTGSAKVGDIVTVTGTVIVDKDFGSGYNYAVLVEKATIK